MGVAVVVVACVAGALQSEIEIALIVRPNNVSAADFVVEFGRIVAVVSYNNFVICRVDVLDNSRNFFVSGIGKIKSVRAFAAGERAIAARHIQNVVAGAANKQHVTFSAVAEGIVALQAVNLRFVFHCAKAVV